MLSHSIVSDPLPPHGLAVPPGSSVYGIFLARIPGCLFLPQVIFSTQELNPCLLCLLRQQAGSLPQVPPEKPNISVTHKLSLCPLVINLFSPPPSFPGNQSSIFCHYTLYYIVYNFTLMKSYTTCDLSPLVSFSKALSLVLWHFSHLALVKDIMIFLWQCLPKRRCFLITQVLAETCWFISPCNSNIR